MWLYRRWMLLLLGCSASILWAIPGPLGAKPSYVEFDAPKGGQILWVRINNQNVVTGYYERNYHYHAFVGAAGDALTWFDVPHSQSTQATAINNLGDITGSAFGRDGVAHGFVRANDGTTTTFDAPGSNGTFPQSINDQGVVTGIVGRDDEHGFVRAWDGSITVFDVPDADVPVAVAINSSGNVAGYAMFSAGYSGFLRKPNGRIIVFAVEGAQHTFATAIDDDGNIAGFFENAGEGVDHPYLRAADGTITTFDVPDHPSSDASGIVARKHGSEIVGTARDQNISYQGLIRHANGTLTVFRAPGAGTGFYQGTLASGINSKSWTSGSYIDVKGKHHGFVRIP